MRTFAQGNFESWDVCPICKTASWWEIILVPISWTSDDWLAEATQVHTACIQDTIWFYPDQNIVVCTPKK